MASDPIRLAVVVIAIIALIVLITKFRIHPFIALILASWFLGIACGLPLTEVIKHFEKGFGDVLSFVGIVIGIGAGQPRTGALHHSGMNAILLSGARLRPLRQPDSALAYRWFFVLMECASLWKVDAIEAVPGALVGLDRFTYSRAGKVQ